MLKNLSPSKTQHGFSLIEALVAMVILVIGLLGLAALIVQTNRAEFESYQKRQALILLQDMADRLANNRLAASCYAITTDTANGTPYIGTSGIAIPSCLGGLGDATQLANQRARATADLTSWSNGLLGTAEVIGANNAGGALNARGCVHAKAPVAVGAAKYTPYIVSVAWQAKTPSAPPSGSDLNCGKNTYPSEDQRRVVSIPVYVPELDK